MSKREGKKKELSRREFIRLGLAAPAAVAVAGPLTGGLVALAGEKGEKGEKAKKVDVWIFHGKNKTKLMEACLKIIAKNGGFGAKARSLALKTNAAWNRTPEQGANTHPELVDAFLTGCKAAGIKKLVMAEHPSNPAKPAFERSGIGAVAKKHGVELIDLKTEKQHFRNVKIPKGKKLKEAKVAGLFLDADVLINMPVAKHHGATKVTCAMKNWMGTVQDRRFWHRNNLHQCIADYSSFIRPTWTIIDATRIMLDRGPKGPAKNMKTPDLLILSRDQVAADVCATQLFHKDPYKVKYLAIARDMKLGVTDPKDMAIHKIEVS